MIVGLEKPIFLALDVDDYDEVMSLVEQTYEYVGGFKLGPRLCVKYGSEIISKVAERGPVFVDNKYYDIPNTMVHAVKASFDAGASYVTVHASSGPEALKEMAKLEEELNKIRPFQIFAVTILTSFSQETLPVHHNKVSIEEQVKALASMVKESGLTAVVCSSEELPVLKSSFPNMNFITPGIRLPEDEVGDQKRVMGPSEAMKLGATALVVGRPIYKSKEPKVSAKKFSDLIVPS